MAVSRNKYKTSRETRIANYFFKACPDINPAAEQQFVSMLNDIGDLLAKWDLIVEEETRRIVRGLPSVISSENIEDIKRSALERIKIMEPLETNGSIPQGSVKKHITLMTELETLSEAHFSSEIALLTRLKEYCFKGGNESEKEDILRELRKLQYEKSVAYVTDCYFALALRNDLLLPRPIEPLTSCAFIHECIHDIREWKRDLNNSIFNYFLILINLNIAELDERKKFYTGYMMTDQEDMKSWCASIFKANSDIVKREYLSLKEEVDVLRTFIDDLLVGAFDESVSNLEVHILR